MSYQEPIEEVTFIALPSSKDLKRAGAHEEVLRRYMVCQRRIRFAQEACAIVATQVLRPDDYMQHQQEFRRTVEEARYKRNQALLAVFSEKCTKGLT